MAASFFARGLALFSCVLLALALDLAPEDQPVVNALNVLGENREILDDFAWNLPIDDDRKQALLARLISPKPQQTITCDACLAFIDVINAFIEDNGTYSEIRDDIIGLCNDVLSENYNKSEQMCPGLMDSYAPHVLYILRTKPMQSNEVCYKFNLCEVPNPDKAYSTKATEPIPSKQEVVQVMHDVTAQRKDSSKQTTFKVAQINDLHLDPEYEEGTATDCGYLICCRRRYEGKGVASGVGEYTCNTSPKLIDMVLDKVQSVQPDFVMYLGDNPPHSTWEETKDSQHNETRRAVDLIAAKIKGKKTYPAIGNHEAYPTNLYYLQRPEIQDLNRVLVEKWPSISPIGQEQINTIQKAAYYSMLAKPGLRIISYNTNYGYTFNFYVLLMQNPDAADYSEMKQFMESTLTQAKTNGEKVIMMGHHPIGRLDSEVTHAQWLTDLVLRFQDIIVLHVHGHTHKDGVTLFVDENDGLAKSVSFTAPSVTTFTNYNPALRVFTLDANTYQVLDYEQYYVPIPEGNNATIRLSYTAKNEYGLTDMSPQSWQDLTKRMESDRDLFLKYRRNTYTKSGKESPCDNETCKYETICEIRNSVYRKYAKCVDTNVPPTTEPPITAV